MKASVSLSPKHQMFFTQHKALCQDLHLGPTCGTLVMALDSGVSQTWVQILNVTLTSCVALDRCFMLSVPQLSCLQSEDASTHSEEAVRVNDSIRKCLVSSDNSVNLHYYILWCSKSVKAERHLLSSIVRATWIFLPSILL